MNRVMLDLETLGVEAGSAIASIGAVRFDRGLEEEFYRTVSLQSNTDAGLNIDGDTLAWWLGQPEEARIALRGGVPLRQALSDFSDFYGNADEIWANSPAFDCIILRAAYDAVGMAVPWHYTEERDFRTLRKLPIFRSTEQKGVDHNALDDAKNQARAVIASLS